MGKLTAKWSKKQNDLIYRFPTTPDGRLLDNVMSGKRLSILNDRLEPSFIDELVSRGYDLTTLKFSIKI